MRADPIKPPRSFNFSLPFLGGVPLVSKLMFIRNLRVMVAAGVSLPRSLSILSEQIKSKRMKRVMLQMKDHIVQGKSFSDSLALYPDVFSDLFVSMVKVGEETGTLEDVLNVLSAHMEKDHQLRSRVKSAMIYPSVILGAMIIIGIVMMIFVIPKLAQVFSDLNTELPATTRFIISTGNFMASFWYLIPIFIILLAAAFRTFIKTKFGKAVFDAFLLVFPGISGIVRKTNSAYTVRTLSSLISAGVPIVRSLEIVSSSVSNEYYKRAVIEISEKVRKGEKLSEAIAVHKDIYPPLVIQMVEVGAETGETAEILKKLAEFYEEEVSNATKNLSTIIEPILMLIIGAAVAFFAISMIQPIYGMMETL